MLTLNSNVFNLGWAIDGKLRVYTLFHTNIVNNLGGGIRRRIRPV